MQRALPALVFCALALVTRWPILHRSVLDWDESLYYLMAQHWRAGHLPYTTIWDNKPLGIYAIFALFQSLIPGIAAIRLATAAFVALLAGIIFAVTQHLTASRPAAWVAGLLLILCSLSNDGLSANSELFMASFTALALLAVLTQQPAWISGLALGCGFMVKYVMAPEALVILLLLLSQRGWRPTALAAATAGLPLLAAGALYAATGHLTLWWDCSVLSNVRRAGVAFQMAALQAALATQFWRWGPLYVTAAALAVTSRRRRPLQNLPLLWLLAALLGAASAKSFYDHYFLQALPPLCVLAGQGWFFLQNRALRAALLAALISLPTQAGWLALRWAMGPDQPAQIAATLTAAHAQSLYVFDGQPILYALTGLPAPTRYVLPSELVGLTLPQVAGINPAQELARILATHPNYILCRAPAPSPASANMAIYAQLHATLTAHYHLAQSWPGAALYQFGSSAVQRGFQLQIRHLRGLGQAPQILAAKKPLHPQRR